MDRQTIVKEALYEMSVARAMMDQANQRYYNAKRKLEGLYPSTPPRGADFEVDPVKMAKMLLKKPKRQIA